MHVEVDEIGVGHVRIVTSQNPEQAVNKRSVFRADSWLRIRGMERLGNPKSSSALHAPTYPMLWKFVPAEAEFM
jgi:hypothetical protein